MPDTVDQPLNDDSPNTLCDRALQRISEGDHVAADLLLKAACETVADDYRSRHLYGRFLLNMNQPGAALAHAKAAYSLCPDQDSRGLLAETLSACAYAIASQADAASIDINALLSIVRGLAALEETDRAVALLDFVFSLITPAHPCWQEGIQVRDTVAPDLTYSPRTEKVWLEVTSRCNLRCTYCHVTHGQIPPVDLDLQGFETFIRGLKARHATELIFNGRGENSFLDGWHRYVGMALDAGLAVTAVTNLARVYSDDELAVLSRYASITVSVNTTDPAIFKEIRRKADIRRVFANIVRLRSLALAEFRRPPAIVWNMILHNLSLGRLGLSVAEGIAVGVDHFHLSVLGETEEIPDALCPRQLDCLSREEFAEGMRQLAVGYTLVQIHNRRMTMAQGLADLLQTIAARLNLAPPPAVEIS